MGHFKFGIFTIVRILIILSLCMVFGFIFGKPDLFFSQIIISSLILILSIELIRYVNRTNKELKKLFNSIKYQDFSASFGQRKLDKSFDDLSEVLSEIVRAFRNVKIEKEAQFQLLQVVIDQINVGIVAVRSQHEIVLLNKKATDILEIPGLNNWNIDFPLIAQINEHVKAMKSHGNKLLELKIGSEIKQIAFHVSNTVYLEEDMALMTFHDIRSEIEQKEIEAWYKLIRILTHEVMNSITPLSSLTETILMLLESKDRKPKDISEITNDELNDIRNSIKTIQGRSAGILDFVDAYRRLTNIPHPNFEKVRIKNVVDRVENLYSGELKNKKITFKKSIQNPELSIDADNHLIEQVLINLVSNSIYALDNFESPTIEIKSYAGKYQTVIEVTDNGKGISTEKIDKVFIPFFSTREKGSGIGLSLSKQIIYLHHGRIKVKSTVGKGTTFKIELISNS